MLWEVLKQALLAAPISAALIALGGAIFKNTILGYFKGSLDHHFNSKIEELKSDLRKKETEIEHERQVQQRELDHIRSFLTESSRERSSILLKKRIEASESLLEICTNLQKLNFLVETVKIINLEAISKEKNKSGLQSMFSMIFDASKADETLKIINTTRNEMFFLYLSEETMKYFSAYRDITLHATMIVQSIGAGLDLQEYVKTDVLKNTLTKAIPSSEDGFTKYGESHAYYWLEFLRQQIITSLRNSITGEESARKDMSDALTLLVSANNTREKAKQTLKKAGISDELMRKDPEPPAS